MTQTHQDSREEHTKIRDVKSIDRCNLCMKFHAHPHYEHICYKDKYPRFESMPDKEKMLFELRKLTKEKTV